MLLLHNTALIYAKFFPRFILYSSFFPYFCSFMVVWGLGFFELGSLIGFLGFWFSVDVGLWCGAFWVFGLGLSI